MKMKYIIIYLLLFYILILGGCTENKSYELRTSDVELHTNKINYNESINKENDDINKCFKNTDFKIYCNDSEIPYDEIWKYEHINSLHTQNIITEKLDELSDFFDEGEYATKIKYRKFISDFDNDGKDDIILSQEWVTNKDNSCSYTYLWYFDEDNICKEIFFCGYGQNGLLIQIINGQAFLCWLPEVTSGATPVQKVKCFLISKTSFLEIDYNDGDLWYGSLDNSDNSGVGAFVVVDRIRKLKPIKWNGSEFYL